MKVAVCIITCLRPMGLELTLEGISRLTYRKCAPPMVTVVVVDNDVAGGARRVCQSMQQKTGLHIEYGVEVRRGIPFARNKSVALAGEADFIAFIDDDEIPESTWLDELIYMQNIKSVGVVTGPVLPLFATEPPAWIRTGGYFDRPRHPDGQLITYARTGNVLVGRAVFLAIIGEPFDTSLALTGGEDTHFFIRASELGFHIVWADRAIVHESVPPSRQTANWILLRSFRMGNTLGLIQSLNRASYLRRGTKCVTAMVRIAWGLCLLVSVIWRGVRGAVDGLRRVLHGAGEIAGIFGLGYKEYQVIHGE